MRAMHAGGWVDPESATDMPTSQPVVHGIHSNHMVEADLGRLFLRLAVQRSLDLYGNRDEPLCPIPIPVLCCCMLMVLKEMAT